MCVSNFDVYYLLVFSLLECMLHLYYIKLDKLYIIQVNKTARSGGVLPVYSLSFTGNQLVIAESQHKEIKRRRFRFGNCHWWFIFENIWADKDMVHIKRKNHTANDLVIACNKIEYLSSIFEEVWNSQVTRTDREQIFIYLRFT